MLKKKAKPMTRLVRHLITKTNPKSPISEQYRMLRTNIQFSGIDKKIKSVLVTSADPAAGKSMTTANLAIVYAQQGLKTLLIDADMRKPTMHYTFREDNLSGLSNALLNGASFINVAKKTDINYLSLLTSGPIPPNPSELLASKKFEQYLTEAYETFDMIIIDTPPILAVTDAKILVNQVDGVILIARSHQTETEQLKEAVTKIKTDTDNLLGIVLNDIEKSDSYNYYYTND